MSESLRRVRLAALATLCVIVPDITFAATDKGSSGKQAHRSSGSIVAGTPQFNQAQLRQLELATQLALRAKSLEIEGKHAEAVTKAQQVLTIRESVLGIYSPELVSSLEGLSELYK